jgi:hypothetical protein
MYYQFNLVTAAALTSKSGRCAVCAMSASMTSRGNARMSSGQLSTF